jgi:hypothetical protein
MLKSAVKIFFILLFASFVIIQFFRPNFENPSVNQSETLESAVFLPENVAIILKRSCSDCHSSETVYPWYARIQPSAWFLASHITDGRRHLNFSVWDTYEDRRKKRRLGEICDQVERREMPLPSYLWVHRNAQMSDEDIKVLCNWANGEAEKIVLP